MRIEIKCSTCGKQALVVKSIAVGAMEMSTLQCGHKLLRKRTASEINATAALSNQNHLTQANDLLEALGGLNDPDNWKALMPYQREGVLFAEAANHRMILADDMGLGKTVQFIVMLDRQFKALTKCLIVCPPSMTTHWERFLRKWLQPDKYNAAKPYLSIYIHKGRNIPLPDDIDIAIIGNNLINGEFTMQSILENEYKCLAIDECHHFKDDRTKRTKALIELSASIPHVIAMSGTPVVNRVDEYFPILHVINPLHWPDKRVLNNICERDSNGRSLQIKKENRDWFFNRTRGYILRRKKNDHLTGLPKFTRIHEFLDPESLDPQKAKRFAAAYNELSDRLEEALVLNDQANILGILSTLRRVTGEAKAHVAVERALDILDTDEESKEKLIIAVHHKNTATILAHFFKQIAIERRDDSLIPLMLGASDATEKDRVKNQFSRPEHRVLIVSIIACSEGVDGLQNVCSRMLIIEREWNSMREEQLEARLNRYGQQYPVQAIYYMMARSIDEWFHELVELKRNIVNSTYDESFDVDPAMMRELAQKVVMNRMRIIGV